MLRQFELSISLLLCFSYYFPINYLEGVHIDIVHSIQFMKFDTVEDFELFVSRLEKLPHRVGLGCLSGIFFFFPPERN